MSRAISLPMLAKRAAFPLVCLLLALYFAYHAIVGDYGLVARDKLQHQAAELGAELRELQALRRDLELHVSLMRPESLDPDMLDERARETLNLAHPNDITIFRSVR